MTDFGSVIAKVVPGTFVPDMGAADETPKVSPIPGGAPGAETASGTTSFKDTLKNLLADVNGKLQGSDAASRDFADGKTNDLQKVVTSVEEANLALEYTMALRSKLLQAYSQISQMQV